MLSFFAVLLGAACAPSGSAGPTPAPKQEPASQPTAGGSPAPVAGGTTGKQYPSPPAMSIDPNKQYTATISTNLGEMKAQLFPKDAPATVNNFVFLARDGFYNGTPFHRIISGFMAQGGDPTGTGRGGPGYRFNDELPKDREYERGTLAMANAGPNTQGSQFFICLAGLKSKLQKNYTIFGKVTEGLDTLDKIAATPVKAGPNGEQSSPTQDVQISTVAIQES